MKTQTCRCCGKPITFVRCKATTTAVPVEPQRFYFIPNPEGERFLLANGNHQTGSLASDGLCGYREHICRKKPARPALSEKELARRCYY